MKPERRTDIGRRWMDPDRILERAYELTGRDPGSASVVIPDRSGSSRSQALADLEVYEEVDEIYSALVDGGWEEIRMEMARVLQDKSLLLYYLEDVQAAVREIDRVIGLLAGFSESECEPEIGRCLSDMYTQKAVFLWKTGHAEQTIPLYDQALKYQEQVIRSADSIETRSALATILLNKGNALVTSGRLSEGIDIYDRCLKIRESLELNDPVRKLNDIAVVLMNKAISLSRSHRNPEAWECDQRVIRIREKLAASRDSQAKYDLAMAYSNASVNLLEMKQNEISLEFNRKALSLIEELVHRQGRNDLIDELIRTKLNLAVSLADSGQTDPALLTVDDAIRQREDQIVNKGRDDQRVHLGKLFYAKAGFLFDKNRYQKALEQYMLALKVWEDLATAGKDMTSRMNLPKTCFGISQCLYYSGDVPSAIEYASRAVDLAAELTQGNQICQLNYPQGVFLAWQSVLNTATGNPSDPEPIHRKFINHLKFLSLTSDPSGEVPQDYDNGRSAKDNVLCALKFFRDLMKGHRIIQFSHLIDEMEKLLTGENIN